MSKVVIGSYIVDLDTHRIFTVGDELTVEPKVIEVLCYLITHRERFVSLQELHENIWTGRVVTDTAVRKTISKLRQLLNDTDVDNPRFIKSQMKRGYQLNCAVSELAAEDIRPEVVFAEATTLAPGSTATNAARRSRLLVILSLPLLVISLCYLAVLHFTATSARLFEVDTLLSIPGQKASLSVSKDGRLHAFVAKVNASDNWELFLYDNDVGQLQKIATPRGDTRFVSFVANDTKLAYIVYRDQQSYLYTQLLTDLNQASVLLPTPEYAYLFGPLPLNENQLLLSAAKHPDDNAHYYIYDLLQHSFEQFTYSSNQRIEDAFANISPNQELLALGRVDVSNRKVDLHIYRLADKELLAEYPLQDNLADYYLNWVDNSTLLTRVNATHQLLRISDGAIQPVAIEPYSLREFHISANGDVYGLDRQIQSRQVFQVTWPFNTQFDKNFQFGPEVTAVWFSNDPAYLWLRAREDNENRLYRYYPESNERQLVFSSTAYLFINDQSSDSERLLLTHNNRIEVYDTATAQTTAVTISTQSASSPSFSADEQAILFAEKVQTKWQIKHFDLSTHKQKVLLDDYKYLAQSRNGFVAATVDGEVWLLDEAYNRRQLLSNINIADYNYDLQVRDDRLMLVHRNLMGDWMLSNIDLTSYEKWQRKIPFYEFSLTYSLDAKAENLIYMTQENKENQLVKYGYNFGYNFFRR